MEDLELPEILHSSRKVVRGVRPEPDQRPLLPVSQPDGAYGRNSRIAPRYVIVRPGSMFTLNWIGSNSGERISI